MGAMEPEPLLQQQFDHPSRFRDTVQSPSQRRGKSNHVRVAAQIDVRVGRIQSDPGLFLKLPAPHELLEV